MPGKNLELTFSHFLPPSLWASQVLLRKDCSLSPWLYDSFSSFRTGCAVTGKVLIFYHAYICLVDESENRKVIKGKAFRRKWPRKIREESFCNSSYQIWDRHLKASGIELGSVRTCCQKYYSLHHFSPSVCLVHNFLPWLKLLFFYLQYNSLSTF